jgi:hypothetical protein
MMWVRAFGTAWGRSWERFGDVAREEALELSEWSERQFWCGLRRAEG